MTRSFLGGHMWPKWLPNLCHLWVRKAVTGLTELHDPYRLECPYVCKNSLITLAVSVVPKSGTKSTYLHKHSHLGGPIVGRMVA